MINPEYKYIDYAYGGVDHRNHVVEITSLPPHNNGVDCYRTFYRYPVAYLTHFQMRKTVGGYKDTCYADFIPFDIDSEKLDDSYRVAVELINVLKIDYEYAVNHVYFSGAKGFHILIPSVAFGGFKPSKNLPRIFKGIAQDLSDDLPVDNIYDINRLFRISNTKNSKSGLFKVALTMEQFDNGLDYILSEANLPNDVKVTFDGEEPNEDLTEVYKKHSEEPESVADFFVGSNLSEMMEADVGERNNKAIRFAGLLRRQNINGDLFDQIMKMWNSRLEDPLPESELFNVIKSSERWATKEEMDKRIYRLADITKEYEDYVKSSKKVNLGITVIDEAIRGIRPGQVMTLMGFTGNYKSALLQWILRHYARHSDEPVVFFQLEMSIIDMYERHIQQSTNLSGRTIEGLFKDGNQAQKQDLLENGLTGFENYYMCDTPGITLNEMYEYAELVQEQTGKKIGLIGLDFVQLMGGEARSNAERVDRVAKDLKTFARKVDVPLIVISQVTDVENEYDTFGLMDARDSKTIGHMSDYVLGIRLESEENDNIQIITIHKNRKGGKGKVKMRINKESLRFEEQ